MAMMTSLFVSLAGCGSMEYAGTWRSRDITIDGRQTEWENLLTRLEDQPIMFGVVNDSNFLYLILQTSDRPTMRQLMFRGLTVWFDRTGGDEKRFGIHYPLGIQGMEMRMPPRDREAEPNRDENPFMRMPVDTTEIEILGPMENERHRMSVIELREIRAKFQIVEGTFIYELQIPLADIGADPYAIGTSPGGIIGVGLETGERMERPAGGEGMMPPQGGEGRGDRRGRGGMEGPPGGGRMGMQSSPLNVWGTVRLALPAAAK